MNSNGNEEKLHQISSRDGGQKVYVWIVTASTLLLLALALWPMSVKNFQTSANFQVRYDPSSGLQKRSINQLVIEAVDRNMEPAQLAQLFADLGDRIQGSKLTTRNPAQLRETIRVQSRPADAPNSIQYNLSLQGRGTSDEVTFVNSLISRVSSDLGHVFLGDSTVSIVDRLTEDINDYQLEKYSQFSSHIDSIISNVATAQNDLQILSTDLVNFSASPDLEQDVVAYPEIEPLARHLQQLKSEKASLLQKPGHNEFHPSILPIQKQIEALDLKIEKIKQSSESRLTITNNQAKVIQNQFVAHRKSSELDLSKIDFDALDRIISEIKMVNLESPRRELVLIKQQFREAGDDSAMVLQRMNDRAKSELQTSSPIQFEKFSLADRSKPIGGVPSLGNFLLLLGFAAGFGTVVTWMYDPNARRRHFRSMEQMQNNLGLPVVGVLRSQPNRYISRPMANVISTRILKICELSLLLMLGLLVIAALVNSEVVAAFLENPFHGVAKTFWLFAPNK